MSGFYSVHRELFNKPIWLKSTAEQKVILIALLGMANHAPNQWEWNGEKMSVERGQMITSAASIIAYCGKGIERQNVRTALKRFEKLEFLTIKSTTTGMLITICNYSSYQDSKSKANQQSNQDLTKTQPRPNQDLTTNNNDNKNNNDKKVNKNIRSKELAENNFSKFWSAYPKKVAKSQALKSFTRLNPSNELLNEILANLRARSNHPDWTKDGGQYIPNPTTYLNQKRWEDQLQNCSVVSFQSKNTSSNAQQDFQRKDYRAGMEEFA